MNLISFLNYNKEKYLERKQKKDKENENSTLDEMKQ